MHLLSSLLGAGLLAIAVPVCAANVSVAFVQPESYADAGYSRSTWPRIKLRYTLARGDQVVAGGEEQLADMNFRLSGNRYSSTDRLRYEKALLDDWFEKRIGKR